MSKRSSTGNVKSSKKKDVPMREKYALVFYIVTKSTGVVRASEIRSKVKLGSTVNVPDPFDWAPSTTKFQAKLIKYGYDPEFLYNVPVNGEGVEIKPADENQERVARKQQERVEDAEKRKETAALNQNVLNRTPLFSHNEIASGSGVSTSSIVHKTTDGGLTPSSDRSTVNTEEPQTAILVASTSSNSLNSTDHTVPPASSSSLDTSTSHISVNNSTTPEPNNSHTSGSNNETSGLNNTTSSGSNNATRNFNYDIFVAQAEAAKIAKTRLPLEALPPLDCFIPNADKVALGDLKHIYITKKQAINLPWVVPQPQDIIKCQKPDDNPNAVFPRAFVKIMLELLVPNHIVKHLRGPTIPTVLFEAIRDFTNGRIERKYKLLPKTFTLLISDCARKTK